MKFSALLLQRFVLVSILAFPLGSCIGNLKSKGDQSSESAKVDPVIDQTLAAAPEAAPAVDVSSSRILSTADQDLLGLELLDATQGNQLIISTASTSDYTVTRLNDPARIVIDIKGSFPHGMTRSYDLADSELLSRIRVGSHPDKSRVVLDLVDDRAVEHKVDTRDGSIVVTLATNHMNADLMAAALTSAGSASGDVAIEASPAAPEAILVADESAKASPELETTELSPETEQLPAAAPDLPEPAQLAQTSSELKNVQLEQISPSSNILIAEVSNPGDYNFEKTAPSEYVLTLKNTRLSSEIATIVAQPDSGLIRSARPVVQGDDVLVRVFAQAGTRLGARVGPDKIVISVKEGADMRAQAAPAEAPADNKPAADTPVVESKPGAEVKVSDTTTAGSELADDEIAALMPKKYRGRLISLDLQDTDIDNALRIIAEVSNLNIIASDDVTGKVTLRLIDVPWDQALDVILKTNGLDKVQEGNVIRIAPIDKLNQERQALKQLELSQAELEPLQVKYVRISYAKAAELKPLVESVVSERGVVSYDERTNQLIIKDITAGIRNTLELVSRIDLRTPQVLLETQIVEANRNMLRDLGAELGFQFIASAATGNPTGMNFPNTVNLTGSAQGPGNNTLSSFPAQKGAAGISLLLGSADGTRSLDMRLSAYEQEGRARIISRPAVATTNNRPANIKSVEKIRIKTPQGGLSVATGQGASASGSSSVATETVEVGITLDVTPQASPDYYVLLDVKAKSSTFGSQVVDGIPSEIERSANSTVLVSSGQTFALGGIYRMSDSDSVTGMPFFKDIPVLGVLFRQQRVDNRDEELLFFITPRIIEGSFDDAIMKVSS